MELSQDLSAATLLLTLGAVLSQYKAVIDPMVLGLDFSPLSIETLCVCSQKDTSPQLSLCSFTTCLQFPVKEPSQRLAYVYSTAV